MTELPTAFGKYFLTEKLATGGMAEIYLAKLVGPGGFEKQLVIKQIHPKLSGQRHFVDLFVTEAKTLVTLAHGNIVPVYELGVIDDTYFIAMEYIDGPTLYRLTEALAAGKGVLMEPALAAWIAARILEGLDYAHRKGEGVIHRDLSPRNVMLSRDGEVKLVDFGIAVALGTTDNGHDVQAAPTGSFPYMSPEQVRREALTGQTDLFSVGVLLWEMLVGERLFARADPDATLAAVTEGEIPRPSARRADVPARLDDVVMRALARDRETRWASAGEMLGQLQRYLYSLDETPGPRDLAALVARCCPPETRRMPTHADAVIGPEPEGTPPPGPAGPRTAVIPRDAPAPRGRQRARTETFATHVELEHILQRATPLFGVEALAGEPPRPAGEPAPAEPVTQVTPPEPSPPHDPASTLRTLPVPGRTPPSRALLVLAAIGTLVLGVGAIVMFLRVRDRVLATTEDAAVRSPDAAPPAILDAPALDALAIATPPDAGGPRDASPARIRDDAAIAPTVRPDAPPRATGTATLKIGAEPWGEIEIDGTPRGRTPAAVQLPAGKHVVEVIYRGEDPPRSKRFPVDLDAGETEQVHADFTKP